MLDIEKLVAQSSYLSERLEQSQGLVDLEVTESASVEKRLQSWCDWIAKGDWDIFSDRLHLENHGIDTISPILGDIKLHPQKALPVWTQIIEEISEVASQRRNPDKTYLFCDTGDTSFVDILRPMLKVARRRLLSDLGDVSLKEGQFPLKNVSLNAYLNLEQELLKRLSTLCEPTLQFEFLQYQPTGNKLLNLILQESIQENLTGSPQYQEFVDWVTLSGFQDICTRYPVLSRLISTLIEDWVKLTTDLIERLHTDYAALESLFGSTRQTSTLSPLGCAIKIEIASPSDQLSLPSEWLITFESKEKVLYQLKNLDIHHSYNNLLTWINHRHQGLSLRTLKILNCNDYGWIEYASLFPKDSRTIHGHQLKNAGALLCLIYLLGGQDINPDDLIVSGNDILLKTPESLFQPQVSPDQPNLSETVSSSLMEFSCMRTGLIHDGNFLGKDCHSWTQDEIQSLVDGFNQMGQCLIQNHVELMKPDGPLSEFMPLQIHYTFRGTDIYQDLLSQETVQPGLLKNGCDRSILLDRLSKNLLRSEVNPHLPDVVRSEQQALTHLRWPRFTTHVFSTELILSNPKATIQNFFVESGYDSVIKRLMPWDHNELNRQVSILETVLKGQEIFYPATYSSDFKLFVKDSFLDEEFCQQLRHELNYGKGLPGGVYNNEKDIHKIDLDSRRVKCASLSGNSRSHLEHQLTTVQPIIERYFNLTKTEFDKPTCLSYRQGDFYRKHCDRPITTRTDHPTQHRQVTVVIFLNSEGEDNESQNYSGGALNFYYTVLNQLSRRQYCFPLHGKQGLLVAFPASLFHEVAPVIAGERNTIITWFCSEEGNREE